MKMLRVLLFFAIALAAILSAARSARADDEPQNPDRLFERAVTLLEQGAPGEAIPLFEALADLDLRDPVVSLDRGIAYAKRVQIGAEVSGDLGRAAHAFEEARELS